VEGKGDRNKNPPSDRSGYGPVSNALDAFCYSNKYVFRECNELCYNKTVFTCS